MSDNKIDRFRGAYKSVLGETYDSEIRALVEGQEWYRAGIGINEVFSIWVARHIEAALDGLWVFDPLRVSERKFLCENLGIQRSDIVGKTPRELAEAVLQAAGLPLLRTAGNQILVANWQHLAALVDNDESERAAVSARQRAERLLRKILYFYCSTRYSKEFVYMLENPGSLRVPKKLLDELQENNEDRNLRIAKSLTVDGWTDLGFLALALRKYSERLTEAAAQHISGAPLKLFTSQEHEIFSKLGTALQPYTHDRPSQIASMQQGLRDAILEVVSAIANMVSRGVLPDETIVFETGNSIIGPVFRCSVESTTSRYYRAEVLPTVGSKILVVPSTNCDYATCDWVDSPW